MARRKHALDTSGFSPALAAAYALQTAKYATPKGAKIKPEQTQLGDTPDCQAITNASSAFPVIGTVAVGPCTVLMLYDSQTHMAFVEHVAGLNEAHFTAALEKMRAAGSTGTIDAHLLHAHVIGAPHTDAEQLNALENLVGAITAAPGVELKTFDALDKKKPYNVAIDSRNGKLIRGSKLITTEAEVIEALADEEHYTDLFVDADWHNTFRDSFDGTTAEHQPGSRLTGPPDIRRRGRHR